MNTVWTSLSMREGRTDSSLREGVPAGSEQALRGWIYAAIGRLPDGGDRLMRRLDLVVPRSVNQEYARQNAIYHSQLQAREERIKQEQQEATAREAAARKAAEETEDGYVTTSLVSTRSMIAMRYPAPIPPMDPRRRYVAYMTQRKRLLDIIDELPRQLPYKPPPAPAKDQLRAAVRWARMKVRSKEREALQALLDDARMIYRVCDHGRGLERRVTVISATAAVRAVDAAAEAGYPRAAKRLAQAWHKVYSLKPDPGGAYHDAVRAVEAVANPFFLPDAPRPTLGEVRSHLADARSKYELVIADKDNAPASIDAIVQMIGTLWFGHRDRHEGGPMTGDISMESAEGAVCLAACLVQLLSSGAVRRKSLNA